MLSLYLFSPKSQITLSGQIVSSNHHFSSCEPYFYSDPSEGCFRNHTDGSESEELQFSSSFSISLEYPIIPSDLLHIIIITAGTHLLWFSLTLRALISLESSQFVVTSRERD